MPLQPPTAHQHVERLLDVQNMDVVMKWMNGFQIKPIQFSGTTSTLESILARLVWEQTSNVYLYPLKIPSFASNLPGKFDTKPPLSSMLFLSTLGSWSIDNCLAFPLIQITARESPTLPTTSVLQSINMAVTAVEPPWLKSTAFSKM